MVLYAVRFYLLPLFRRISYRGIRTFGRFPYLYPFTFRYAAYNVGDGAYIRDLLRIIALDYRISTKTHQEEIVCFRRKIREIINIFLLYLTKLLYLLSVKINQKRKIFQGELYEI